MLDIQNIFLYYYLRENNHTTKKERMRREKNNPIYLTNHPHDHSIYYMFVCIYIRVCVCLRVCDFPWLESFCFVFELMAGKLIVTCSTKQEYCLTSYSLLKAFVMFHQKMFFFFCEKGSSENVRDCSTPKYNKKLHLPELIDQFERK